MKHKNYKKISRRGGQAMLVAVVFFLAVSLTVILGLVVPIANQVKVESILLHSRGSYFLAEASLEDILYRLQNNKPVSATEFLTLNSGTVTTTVGDVAGGKRLIASASTYNYVRKIQMDVARGGTGVAFHYGIQSGDGGFELKNSSQITGNVFSSGSITGVGNTIRGDVISAKSTGLVDGINATGTIYAHTISSSIAGKDAYYTNIDSYTTSHVAGTLYPGSPDQPTVPLPISDNLINQWEAQAAAGGTISGSDCSTGTYNINSNTTLGPKKIACDLQVKGGITLTLTGHLWVAGNITTNTNATIKISAALGNQNVAFIADNPADRAGSGIVSLNQQTTFLGSGAAGSFVFIISQNNSSETGGTTDAITVNQGTGALVGYASHGQITLAQSVGLKEVTAYKIILKNTANVVYDTGLPNTLFSDGPSGSYDIIDWKEVQ